MTPDNQGRRRVDHRVQGIIEREGRGNNGCHMRKDREDQEENDRGRRIKGKGDHVGRKDNGSLMRKESPDRTDLKGKMPKNDSSRNRQDRNRNKQDSSRDSRDEPRENNTRNLIINNWHSCRMKAMQS
jgi:hypothetical protein